MAARKKSTGKKRATTKTAPSSRRRTAERTVSNERGAGKGKGQAKTHQVRNIASGEITDVSQADWRNRTQYPRDQFERVDAVNDDDTTTDETVE